jgi:hypothetical protein
MTWHDYVRSKDRLMTSMPFGTSVPSAKRILATVRTISECTCIAQAHWTKHDSVRRTSPPRGRVLQHPPLRGCTEVVTNVWSAARLQGEIWSRRQVCANVFGLWMESSSPGQDELRAWLSFKTRRSLKTIRNIRLQTRRCDCSFVLTAPVQTFGGETLVVVVVKESRSARSASKPKAPFPHH